MNFVSTSDLRSGQVFSEPVYLKGEHMLIPANVPVCQRDIDALNTWGIEYICTDGVIVETKPNQHSKNEPGEVIKEALEDQIKETTEEPEKIPEEKVKPLKKAMIKFSISDVSQNSVPYRKYKAIIEKLNSLFTSLKFGADIEMRMLDAVCDQLLKELRENMDSFVGFILGGEISGHELAKSSVNTAILSALTAQELKLQYHKIYNIVAGALIHDVGMLRLSKGITEKRGSLSEAELEQIKSHPLHTSNIVTKELLGPQEVNLIALQHHERWDGNGYPNHLSGQAIDIGARIVSIADAFEAMVSKKSYRNPMIGYKAIKTLMADNGLRFDPAVLIAFTKIIGIYPIGSIVRFNDSSVGRVVSLNSETPVRPVVQMLMDNNGKALDTDKPKIVNLLNVKTLFIKEAIDPAEFENAEADE